MYVDFEPVELVIPNNKVKEYFKNNLLKLDKRGK